MRSVLLYILSLSLLILLNAACKNDKAASTTDVVTAVNLADTDWEFYMIEENGKKEAPPAGVKINMAFLEGKITGNASCNSYTAPYILENGKISIGDVVATEKYCENENWDARFVSAIKKAETCEVSGELLSVKCSNGVKLSFSKKTLESIQDLQNQTPAKLQELLALFPNLAPNQMHLYSILLATNIEAYPFVGETIAFNMYNLFDPTSTSVFQQSYRLGAYALGKIGDMYILRVPGNKGSNSITLYRLKGDKLIMEMPLALANDEPSVNVQQDAWLKDLNNDGKIEIILRQTSAPLGGNSQDVIRVFAQAGDGSFQPSFSIKVNQADYPMAVLK